jgi:hypothetical protein
VLWERVAGFRQNAFGWWPPIHEIPLLTSARWNGESHLPYFVYFLDSSKIPKPQSKLPPGPKMECGGQSLQPHPNERARRITVTHHLAAFAVVTGTIPGPPKTSFIIVQARVFFAKKVTTIPDLSNICGLYEPSRVDRGQRVVGLSDFPDDNPR